MERRVCVCVCVYIHIHTYIYISLCLSLAARHSPQGAQLDFTTTYRDLLLYSFDRYIIIAYIHNIYANSRYPYSFPRSKDSMDSSNYYYSSPMGTPPKTPGSGPKNLYYPKLNSAPFTPGYFTPPDSRENSPSLGGTSPNPQGQSTFLLPPTPGTSPQTPSFAQCSGRIPRRALPAAAAAAAVLQREESFGSLQLERLADDALHYSGSHGTFGRLDSHRYQKYDPPRTGNPTRSPDLRRYKSNASTIIPLPSTVYVPGVGDSASGHPFESEHHTFHDREERSHFSICDTPLSPPTSFPFLPVEPATPTISARDAPRPASPVSPPAGLTGLWNSAQRTEKTPGPAIDGGKTYELTMYRLVPPSCVSHTRPLTPHIAKHRSTPPNTPPRSQSTTPSA